MPDHVTTGRGEPQDSLEAESTFRLRLASILKGGYKYRVWHSHPEDGAPLFQVEIKLGRPDLYAVPPPYSRVRERFGPIAIETKSELDMNKLMGGWMQAIRYVEELSTARYVINGDKVPTPRLILLATPDSIDRGEVYRWRGWGGSELPTDPQGRQAFWRGMTHMIERFLIGKGASLLRRHRNGRLFFRSNITPSQAIETFFLDDPSSSLKSPARR